MIDYLLMGLLTYLLLFFWILRTKMELEQNVYENIGIVLLWPFYYVLIVGVTLTGLANSLYLKHLKALENK